MNDGSPEKKSARGSEWLQGDVLSQTTASSLLLPHDGGQWVIIISHDCDLTQSVEVEPDVEVIVAEEIQELRGNNTHAKNSRRLDLSVCDGKRLLSLDATSKKFVKKTALFAEQDGPELRMLSKERPTLQRWLSLRYRRSAFSDSFNDRLQRTGVKDKLNRILKSSSEYLRVVYFDVDDGQNFELPDDQVHELLIIIVYATDRDPAKAEAVANDAAKRIRTAITDACIKGSELKDIELLDVEVVSDQAITYADSLVLRAWDAEHHSLKVEPPHPMPDEAGN